MYRHCFEIDIVMCLNVDFRNMKSSCRIRAKAQAVSVVVVVVVMSIIEQSTNKLMRIVFFVFANAMEWLYVIIAQYTKCSCARRWGHTHIEHTFANLTMWIYGSTGEPYTFHRFYAAAAAFIARTFETKSSSHNSQNLMEKEHAHRTTTSEFHMELKQLMNRKQVHVFIWLREWPAHPVMILNYKLRSYSVFYLLFARFQLACPLPICSFLSCNLLQLISECFARLSSPISISIC